MSVPPGPPAEGAENRLTDQEAAELLANYRRMVWYLAYRIRCRFPWAPIDDLASEIQTAFVEASRSFDPTSRGGVERFGLYARKAGVRAGYAFCLTERFRGMKVRGGKGTRRKARPPGFVSLENPLPGQDEAVVGDLLAAREPGEPVGDQDAWWRAAAAALTPRQAEVLVLRYRDGLTQWEIAGRLGISQAAVWKRLTEATTRLRQAVRLELPVRG